MIEERAVITGSDSETISFRITGSGACDACSIREACFRNEGTVRLARERVSFCGPTALNRTRHDQVGRDNTGQAGLGAPQRDPEARAPTAGQAVTLRIPHASVLGLTAIVYGVPLVAFLAGLLLGHAVLFDELVEEARALASFGLGLGGLFVAGLVTVFTDRRLSRRVRYEVEA